MGSPRWSRAVALLAALASMGASAHQGGVSGFALIAVDDNVIRHSLTLAEIPPAYAATTADGRTGVQPGLLAALAEHLHFDNAGEACAAAGSQVAPADADKQSVTLVFDYVCREAITRLAIRDDSFDVLGADLHTLARISWRTGHAAFAFATETRATEIAIDAVAPPSSGFGSFFALGVGHILLGYDHLLFLLALLLGTGRWLASIKIVTAFTVAHSLTLALAALDLVRLPSALVEATIAASIAYVAAENLFAGNPASRRIAVTLLFGLVHGFGFSSALREAGLPRDNLLPALFGFNLGVEAGQLLVVLVLVPGLAWLARRPYARAATVAVSGAVCVTGLVLVVTRTLMPG